MSEYAIRAIEGIMQKGFTLVEAAVAMVIVSIGVISIVSMQSTSVIGNSKSFFMSTASSFAEENIETLLAKDYEDIVSYASVMNSSGIEYNLNMAVVADAPVKNCKEVTCSVSWNNRGTNAMVRYVYVCPRYK